MFVLYLLPSSWVKPKIWNHHRRAQSCYYVVCLGPPTTKCPFHLRWPASLASGLVSNWLLAIVHLSLHLVLLTAATVLNLFHPGPVIISYRTRSKHDPPANDSFSKMCVKGTDAITSFAWHSTLHLHVPLDAIIPEKRDMARRTYFALFSPYMCNSG